MIAYQNVVVYPRFKTEIAELKAPEILPSLSLVGRQQSRRADSCGDRGSRQPLSLAA